MFYMTDPRGNGLRTWLADPENRERLQQIKLERRAQRRGVTVEAMARPRTWAPAPERKRFYEGLFREGRSIKQVWDEYPNEDYNILWFCELRVRLERVHALDELL